MPYVKYNVDGAVVAVSEVPLPDFAEVSADDEGMVNFIASCYSRDAIGQTDLGFIRVVEDVVELLMDKNIILFTELPPAAQKKMLERQRLRNALQGSLDLINDDANV